MTCREFWGEMPELASGGEHLDHLRECPSCAALLERHRALAAALKRIAEGHEHRRAPQVVEARLVEAYRAESGPRPAARPLRWLAWASVIAAGMFVSIFLTRGRQPERVPPPHLSHLEAATDQEPVELTGLDLGFIPLPYSPQAAAFGPNEDADLVRLEVPRATLVALGLPVDGGPGRVEALFALGADGVVEGIQIVQ